MALTSGLKNGTQPCPFFFLSFLLSFFLSHPLSPSLACFPPCSLSLSPSLTRSLVLFPTLACSLPFSHSRSLSLSLSLPKMGDIVKAVGNCSYNQLVEKIISCKQSDSSERAGEGGCAGGASRSFLSASPSPCSRSGLSISRSLRSSVSSISSICCVSAPVDRRRLLHVMVQV